MKIHMRSAFVPVLLSLCPAALAAEGAPQAAPRLTIHTDRPSAVYRTGEMATFLIELKPAEGAAQAGPMPVAGATSVEAECELSTDAFRHTDTSRITFACGKAQVSAMRDFPCVVWIRVTCKEPGASSPNDRAQKPLQALTGAAFSPDEVQPSMPPPDDFDAFWAAQKARLDKIPANPRLDPIPSPDPEIEMFSLTLDNINNTKVYGYLAKPKGDGPFPAYLKEQWSGVYSLDPEWALQRAQQGFITLNINPHSIENGKPAEYYKALQEGALKDYSHQGRDSRETCYFLRMFLGCYRAAEYLASRPDWDGKHLIVSGSSLGGGQAIVTAALSPHVTAVMAHAPALCDHTAMVAGRAAGWPKLVAVEDGKPDPVQLEVARYFDVVNFARGVKVPALVGTGFGDLTCPSTGVFAAYNVMPGPKELAIDPLSGHSGDSGEMPNWSKASAGFLATQGKN